MADKNIRSLSGVPLAAWSLFQALVLPEVNRVVLSTDSPDYDRKLRSAVEGHFQINSGWDFVHRDPAYSGATTTLFSYILDTWRTDLGLGEDDLLVSLLPTAPLRRRQTVESAIRLALASQCGTFTAVEYDFPVSFALRTDDEGNWEPLNPDSPMVTGKTRSQDQVRALHPNGGVTSMWGRDLARRPATFYLGSLCIEADPMESADIDTESDLMKLSFEFDRLWDADWGATAAGAQDNPHF